MAEKARKVSVEKLQSMADRGERIAMITAYDYPSGQIANEAEVEMILVGDSLAMVVLGLETTTPVTLDDMLVFMRAVGRAAPNPLLIGDMPFATYLSPEDGVRAAARVMKEGSMDAVKLEGGKGTCDVVEAIVRRGIPVMGHIGLTPQTSRPHGGHRVQGRKASQAKALLEDAMALEEAGAFSVVLELVPSEVAGLVSDRLSIPTIGIGSGPACDGQVLVWHDLLGLSGVYGRHVRRYADIYETSLKAVRAYVRDVKSGAFPDEDQTWHMAGEELSRLRETSLVAMS